MQNQVDPIWKHSPAYSVDQAAALLAGHDPTKVQAAIQHGEPSQAETGLASSFPGYLQARSVLINAITSGVLTAKIRHQAREYGTADWRYDSQEQETEFDEVRGAVSTGEGEVLDQSKQFFFNKLPDWSQTTVDRVDLVAWVQKTGFSNNFFVSDKVINDDFLDPKNSRYSPKLAAAVTAWREVTVTDGKGEKAALKSWLDENAHRFIDKKGQGLSETAKEECASVANWNTSGGKPKVTVS